ncbi:conserved hypothetical protein [Theileria orientalis strain Shintoku]|uniref:Uncharacterized protein n=1 Tax=Theileria orientalis strain Shintoku TaxID=869250 RepID=J4C3E1_THEOR|nr:conserved hypothetical protein [Theileria orientalis strain Shintoku]PVC51595.1 hypothetical protein MACL_00001412 [Theileria orientalis]BAM40281.1 conserved hypothetical protein [Theileria orientalis strain Shintoku]|eukprot:XP_009690582.1 conserved hypothetical protein [Theileria orientalis strain Shintoku]
MAKRYTLLTITTTNNKNKEFTNTFSILIEHPGPWNSHISFFFSFLTRKTTSGKMIIIKLSFILTFFFLHTKRINASTSLDVTVDINKNANNPRKKHYIVNKDVISFGPPGFTEHIYEQDDSFNVTNFYFGKKKLEEGNKEITEKDVEKIAVFWKYETPVLMSIKHSHKDKPAYSYYRLTKYKYWVKIRLTADQIKHLPISGQELADLLSEILGELGDIPEDKPLPGIGFFLTIPVIFSFILPSSVCNIDFNPKPELPVNYYRNKASNQFFSRILVFLAVELFYRWSKKAPNADF